MDKLKETILLALTALAMIFGRLPKIGPVLNLLIQLVTQYWDVLVPLLEKMPKQSLYAVARDTRPLLGAKANDDPLLALVRECKHVTEDGD